VRFECHVSRGGVVVYRVSALHWDAPVTGFRGGRALPHSGCRAHFIMTDKSLSFQQDQGAVAEWSNAYDSNCSDRSDDLTAAIISLRRPVFKSQRRRFHFAPSVGIFYFLGRRFPCLYHLRVLLFPCCSTFAPCLVFRISLRLLWSCSEPRRINFDVLARGFVMVVHLYP
jgi:hypothetical protein